MRDNVHAGEVVDSDHKRALFSVIVGEQGVTLHRQVNDLEKERSDLNGPLRAAKQPIEGNLPAGMKLAAYLALEPDPDTDMKIEDAKRVLLASQEEESLRRHRLFGPLVAPMLPPS